MPRVADPRERGKSRSDSKYFEKAKSEEEFLLMMAEAHLITE